MRICFTGKVIYNGTHLTRIEFTELVSMFGHTVDKQVSCGTDMLVIADLSSPFTKKRADAQKYGCSMIETQDFLKDLERGVAYG